MSSRTRQLCFVATLAALVIGGSAAAASPAPPDRRAASAASATTGAWSLPGLGYLHDVLGSRAPAPGVAEPPDGPRWTATTPAANPGRKAAYAGVPAGAFAGYATATVG